MKANESLCEIIGAVAIGLCGALLALAWFYQVVTVFWDFQEHRRQSIETRADGFYP